MSRNQGIQVRRVLVFGFFLALIATIALAQSWNCRLVGNIGYWSWGSADRFRYDYGAGQWWDNTSFGGWQKLGTVGASAPVHDSMTGSDPNFIGNGAWHNVGTGLSYKYFSSGGYSNWLVNGSMRFAYTYSNGQWADYSSGANAWSLLGYASVSSAFLGDGAWHNVGTGLSYKYFSGGDYSNWLVNGNMRFAYTYNNGWWADYSSGANTWSLVGPAGLSSAFLGDGGWHTVGTGVSYKYFSSGDYSNWLVNGNMRFAYTYGNGLWADYSSGANTWSLVGSAGVASAFLGDGAWHNVGTGLSYKYFSSGDYSNWLVSGRLRFAYTYGTGLWADYSSATKTWSVLGAPGLSSAFLGDGSPHMLDTTWSYTYSGTTGTWTNATLGRDLFTYNYGSGQWQNQGSDLTWENLGPTGLSSAFLGDGSPHPLDSAWSYVFSGTTGTWTNATLGRGLFEYNYGDGQWRDQGTTDGFQALGPSGLSASFIGDGAPHTLDGTWTYQFIGGVGQWTDSADFGLGRALTVFEYDYTTGQWRDQGASGGFQLLGPSGLSASFVGDGAPHTLDSTWTYQFSSGIGTWTDANVSATLPVFKYWYSTGQWWDQGLYGGFAGLGAYGQSSSFMGDGNVHTLEGLASGTWYYKFNSLMGLGYWAENYDDLPLGDVPPHGAIFAYFYSTGAWQSQGRYGGWANLGPSHLSASFMGSGPHTVAGTWTYRFNGGVGRWSAGGNLPVFEYNYATGQWQDQGSFGGLYDLGPSRLSVSFMGDGNPHALDSTWTYQLIGGVGKWTDAGVSATLQVFEYNYANGQWQNQGSFGGLCNLGLSGLSASFMGDGGIHTLDGLTSGTWYYAYGAGNGYWAKNPSDIWQSSATAPIFEYIYSTGVWWSRGVYGWGNVGLSGHSASFVGDGNVHTLDGLASGTWYYMFNSAQGLGYWAESADDLDHPGDLARFRYNYSSGVWQSQRPYSGGWANQGVSGLSASFIGDSQIHNMGALSSGTWYYVYGEDASGNGTAYWDMNPDALSTGDLLIHPHDSPEWKAMFRYDYTTGIWEGHTTSSSYVKWANLGTSSSCYLSPSFVADGHWHDLDSRWSFKFTDDLSATWNYSWEDGSGTCPLFRYNFGTRVWFVGGFYGDGPGGWNHLGYDSGVMYGGFIGDGSEHSLEGGSGSVRSDLMFRFITGSAQGPIVGQFRRVRDPDPWGGTMYRYDYTYGHWFINEGSGWEPTGSNYQPGWPPPGAP
jgi:hypothetical protein